MPEDRSADLVGRRLALYAYLEPLLSGRRVLELRPPPGRAAADGADGAQYLRSLGARVVSVEGDASRVDEKFDVIVVPEGEEIARRAGAVAALRRLLADGGRLIVAVTNIDRGGSGLGYYDLHGAVAASFPNVQMLGVTPFLGMGVVEFEGAVDGLRIDSRLVKEGSEPPAVYVAVAGAQLAPALGYALVQLPFGPLEARLAAGGAAAPAPAGTSNAMLREEIDELRGRLRRAAEDRAALDAEVAKLRRALADADESFLNLTRKTTEEMSAMAARLAAGLRSSAEVDRAPGAELTAARDEADRLRARLAEAEARASAAEQRLEEVGGAARQRQAELEDALERLRLADSELARARRDTARFQEQSKTAAVTAETVAARDQALVGRDDRIARLEAEKQDLVWRMAELEDKLTATIARAVRGDAGRAAGAGIAPSAPAASADVGTAPHADENAGLRARALDEFRKAATAHVDELTHLKASVSEQSALVAELEDAVQAAEARAAASDADATTLRRTAKDLEEADRSRRSRLAELEGKLLRFEHERKSAPPPAAMDEERASWARERDQLRAEIGKLAEHARGSLNSMSSVSSVNSVNRNGHGEAAAQKLDAMAAGVAGAAPPADAAASRLENTLGNYRQRATRLRDELEGVRRRFDALSASEIAVFLEELGDDLAELGK
jgi:predicted  nucleic acid-binding Zn-ribbon protein